MREIGEFRRDLGVSGCVCKLRASHVLRALGVLRVLGVLGSFELMMSVLVFGSFIERLV